MGEISLLTHLVVIVLIAIFIVVLLGRLRIPPLVGFLTAGTLIGPYGFALIQNTADIQIIAHIGVILLLFSIGLEFPLNEFKKYRLLAVLGGTLQIALTILVTVLITKFFGWSLYRSIFLGGILSLSSTSIVMKLLSEKGLTATTSGRISIVLLVFQDIAIIPMLLILPVFGGETYDIQEIFQATTKIIAFLALIYFINRYLLNFFFKEIVNTRNRELFVLSVVLLCFGVALLSQQFGISLALGAFIAGVMVASSEYSYQMSAHILSFRSFFESIFFISIGLLLDPLIVQEKMIPILIILACIFLGKSLICTAVYVLFRYPLSMAVTAGIMLSQIGEFSFILASEGKALRVIDENLFQITVSAAIISLGLTPLLFKISQPFGQWIGGLRFLSFVNKLHLPTTTEPPPEPDGHVVLIGYGTIGQSIGKILKKHKISSFVLDAHLFNTNQAKDDGFYTLLGDSTTPYLLEKARLQKANCVVITISDPVASEHTIKNIRDISGHVPIIVRANFQEEVKRFKEAGGKNINITYAELEIIIDMLRYTLKSVGKSKEEIVSEIESLLLEAP
ncbi:MAG TPA: cation:proton antiporter [Bdellovibrionota bacterium]|nr:cation:proton antiporter [Bdellovibrionota bacterium]